MRMHEWGRHVCTRANAGVEVQQALLLLATYK
jgi:hypothetical protein